VEIWLLRCTVGDGITSHEAMRVASLTWLRMQLWNNMHH
jgi:hypothetical protein